MAVVSLGTNATAAGAASAAITVPVGGAPGSSLIVICVSTRNSSSGGSAFGSVSDSAGNTYQLGAQHALGLSDYNGGFGAIFYTYNSLALLAGNTITYTKPSTQGSTSISVFYATNIQTATDPLDGSVTASTGANSGIFISVTSGAATSAGDLFVGFAAYAGTLTYNQDTTHGWGAPPAAIVGVATKPASQGGGNQINAGTSAITFSPTLSASGAWTAIVVGFLAAGGGNTKRVSVTSAQNVLLAKPLPVKAISISSPSTVSIMRRGIVKSLKVANAQVVSLAKATVKSISILQGQAVSCIKTLRQSLAVVQNQTVGLVALLAYRVVLIMTNDQVVSIYRATTKIISVVQVQIIRITRSSRRAISIVTSEVVGLLKSTGHRIIVLQAQIVRLANSAGRNLTILQGQSILLRRSVSKIISLVTGQIVKISLQGSKFVLIAMVQGERVLLVAIPKMFARAKQVLRNAIRFVYILK